MTPPRRGFYAHSSKLFSYRFFMPPITDPQIATLIERSIYTAKAVDELKVMIADVAVLRRDQDHTADLLHQVRLLTDALSKSQHQIDKRVLVLERWNRGLVWFSTSAMGVLLTLSGYVANFISTLDTDRNQTNNRLSTLEVIVNSHNFERAMANDNRPVAEGSKD